MGKRIKISGKTIKSVLLDILFDIFAGVLLGIGLYTFAAAADFAPGGISGLAIIINHYLKIPIGLSTVILNIPIILISYKLLGKVFLIKSFKSMIITALIIDLVFPLFPTYSGDALITALFAGAASGAGYALIYMRGSSTGGTDFIIMSIRKKRPHLSIGQITMFLDVIVIFAGGFVFHRIDAVLQGLVMTAVSATVIDKLMYGTSSGKITMIITDKGMDIADALGKEIDRGVTLVHAVGTYSGTEKQMLFCACSKAEAFKARMAVYKIDPKAIIMLCPYDEAYGYGFRDIGEF